MTTTTATPSRSVVEARLRGALWSFFSGDALAAPTHWYYGGFQQVQMDYGPNGITTYTKPKMELRGSILNKSDVNGGGRSSSSSSSGKWSLFGSSSDKNNKKEQITIIGDVINHGKKPYWDKHKSIHYHATLQRGENTLEAQLARVLMKTIVQNDGRFNADAFRDAYVTFLQTPGSHNDTYASTCHRMFFSNLVFSKLPPEKCPDNDGHNVDTIDGLILPTIAVLATAAASQQPDRVETVAAQCAAVTRQSAVLEQSSRIWSRLVTASLLEEDDAAVVQQMNDCSQSWGHRRPPSANAPDQMTACYLSQSVPALLNMIAKYMPKNDGRTGVWNALLSNANIGGENVHRGSILGAVLGARATYDNLPTELVQGLHDKEQLEREIEDFVQAVMKN
ncbi:ADP-ribosylglycohydrolase [Seminavis robusta]|uniref:ADP-ribosylglycohydrolase n=1 Tax=Seminavis robusta TaxID=568900 RepID=A0A9N8EBQ2_9STRA|nr:ADP-ribosylglycohydrolase [Seminavis robusta]|eukprot:Sro890_g216750.1 ADP-ribosylglycohydrolase (393) ;mRNA; f:27919-29192